MAEYNHLTIEAYSTGTTPIVDPLNELRQATDINFATQYPGGLYADCSFSVPRQVADWWELQGAIRIVLRNELRQVYEGYITNFQHTVDEDGQYTVVRCAGAWGHILMNWPICKRWADDRITEDAWVLQTLAGTTTLETEEWNIERRDRIHITPKAGNYVTGEYIALRYTMPTNETIKRIYYAYDMAEKAGQSWEMSVWRSTDGTTFSQMGTAETYTIGSTTIHTATGYGTVDVALATASQYAELRFYSRGNNNPVNDDHNHGVWSDLKVFSELGSINMKEIATDIVGMVTDLNTDTMFLSTPASTLSLIPFIADSYDSAADVLNQAVSRGDGAYHRWAVYIVGSERAFVPNGKPLLVVNGYPSITDYDYVVSLRDDNLVLPFTISQDFDSIVNWVVVQYSDVSGLIHYRTPDDNALLKDTTSISTYGRRGFVLGVPDTCTVDLADSIGKRYLASYKDPQYRLTSPIVVSGYIRGKVGHIYPASEIRSSLRVRIEDYLQDVTGTGSGLTFVITNTRYDNDTETCTITTGAPSAPLMLQLRGPGGKGVISRERWIEQLPAKASSTSSGGGGGDGGRTISDAQLAAWGLTRKEWWAIKATPRGKALRATLKKKKKKKG